MKIGYIVEYDLELNPHLTEKFKFKEASYTRRISSRGDRIYSKMLAFPVEYEDVAFTTERMKDDGIIVVREPFFLDDKLREKCLRWVAWANKADPSEYDPFATPQTEKGGKE